jgi:hypothetical protein
MEAISTFDFRHLSFLILLHVDFFSCFLVLNFSYPRLGFSSSSFFFFFFPLSLSFLFLFFLFSPLPPLRYYPQGTPTPFSHLVIRPSSLLFRLYFTIALLFHMRYAAGGGGGVLGIKKKHKTIAIAESANACTHATCHQPHQYAPFIARAQIGAAGRIFTFLSRIERRRRAEAV